MNEQDALETGRGQTGGDPAHYFPPLTPAELNILLALAGHRELHGYGIMKEVEKRTSGKTRLGPGTLYRSIKQMLKRGWIEESEEERSDPKKKRLKVEDERGRRYYRLTELGRRVASAEVGRLEALVMTARERGLSSSSSSPATTTSYYPGTGLGMA